MMKKLLAILMCIVLVMALASCGGGGTDPAVGDTETPAAGEGAASTPSGGGSGGADYDQMLIKCVHTSAENTALNDSLLYFKEIVEERSGGVITVEVYPNGQMGSDREGIEAVQLGNVQVAINAVTTTGGFSDALAILDLPFMFPSREVAIEVLDGPAGDMLSDALGEVNLKNVGWMENGIRHLTSNREVHSPADLRGLKVRTMENQIQLKAWTLAGANPSPLAFTELFTALQQGTFDGQENPYELIYTNRLYEAQSYLIETGHTYMPHSMVVNNTWYNGMSDANRQLFDECIELAVARQRELAIQAEADAKQAIIDSGLTEIITLTDAERAEWKAAMEPVIDDIRATAGDEVVDAFLNAIEAAS